MTVELQLRKPSGKEIRSTRGWDGTGRDVKELARAWTGKRGPESLRVLLDQLTGTADFEPDYGVAGAQTSFDDFRGSRKHDLLLVGEAAGGKTVVSIEAKVDGTFGQTVGEHVQTARRKIGRNEKTNSLDRLQALTQAIAGWDAGADPRRLELRYQLFTAVAGAVAAAVDEEADQAVLCIHEFDTKQAKSAKQEQNEADLRDFLGVVFDERSRREGSWIVGPLKLHGGSERIPNGIPLYVAKLRTPPA